MGEKRPFVKPRGPGQRLAAGAHMNWFEKSWRSQGIRTLGEFARAVRVAAPFSVCGQDSMLQRIRELSEHFTIGYTTLADWNTPPLVWWLEHPEFIFALEVVLGEAEFSPLRESYWSAREVHTRFSQDTVAREIREAAAPRQTPPSPRQTVTEISLELRDAAGVLLDDDYRIPGSYGLPRVGDFISLSLSPGKGRVLRVIWREERNPVVEIEISEEEGE